MAELDEVRDALRRISIMLENLPGQFRVSARQIMVSDLSDLSVLLGAVSVADRRLILDKDGLTIVDENGKPVLVAATRAHTINGEALAIGDVLIGDNSSGKPNMLWDQSAGKFYSRSGIVVAGEITGGTFKQYGAEVRDAGGQTISNDTVSVITFDTETKDDAGFYDAGAPTKLTIPTNLGGVYDVGVWAQWGGNATGMRKVGLGINKSAPYSSSSFAIKPQDSRAAIPTGTPLHYQQQVAPVTLVAGDYIEMLVHQTSGGDLAVVAHMWIRKLE